MRKNKCCDCGKEISKSAKRCLTCMGLKERTRDWSKAFCAVCNKPLSKSAFYHNATKCHKCAAIASVSLRNTQAARMKRSITLGGTGVPYENTEYGSEFTKELKNKIIKRDCCCKICKLTIDQIMRLYDRKPHIHHIDYDKSNNSEENLVALCISCHMVTNTNRDYWQLRLKEILYGNNQRY